MRTIKFRGKDLQTGEWVYGHYTQGGFFITDTEEMKTRHLIHADFLHDVEPETVGQFTGLHDKNGKEIYEGDLVKWGHTDNCHEYPPRIAVVEYRPDTCFRALTPTEHANGETGYVFQFGCFAFKDTENYLEVIGNIHDNPELLTTLI